MQLTKTKEKEILKVYDTWMNAYLNADVATYDRYFDDSYHFIGSTHNEEYLNRKDTTDFFKVTGEQLSGMLDLRNESKILEQFGDYVFLTHICDTWFKNDEDWSYYGRFRLSSVLHHTKEGWKFIYQHFSLPDAKSEEGETIGFDKVHAENQELREAIKRRTTELEAQKRELEIEGALGRIRAQATAMKTSTELLDIVVSMRNEFTKLGHEAHYFWHMMWLPNTYEKAMTSGDGTRIGFVMTLPRHIHGDIPVLANWEKSKDTTVVYAMNTEEAIDYVDKMVALGDFQNIDPQAPSHDDIRHIGGLTFIMARTTHGEIGYSLPGIVKNPPKEAVQILERFADAFDLAHRRFLDLQKAERQAREVEIELALEKVRSRTMAMQHSDELQEASFLLDEQVRGLGIKTWGCAFNIYGEKDSTEWFGNEAGVLPTYSVPRTGIFKKYYDKGQKGETLWIEEFSGKACVAHYETMSALPVIGDVLLQLKETNNGFPTYQIDHVVFFKYGYLLFITKEHVPESYDIFKRFAKVFEQTYTRFLDLQKAEAQARESQIELGLERVRARAMAMQSTNELSDLVANLLHELTKLDFSLTFCIINIINEGDRSNMVWAANPEEGKAPESYYMKFEDYPFHHAMMREWKAQTPKFIYVMEGEEKKIYDDYLYTDTEFRRFPKDVQTANRALDKYVSSFVFSKFGGLQTVGDQHLSDESLDILYRFGKVFDLTYTRFNDLQKAEEQAREAKVEAALERIRSRSLAMTKSEQLGEVILEIHKKFRELDISMESRVAIVVILDSESKDFNQYTASNDVGNFYISTPYCEHPILDDFYAAKEAGVEFFSKAYTEEEKNSYFKHFFETSFTPYEIVGLEEQMQWVFDQKFYTHSQAFQKNSCIGMADYSGIPLNDFEIDTIKRFSKVFDQAYTRFLDLKKAEVQAREAQIEAALEKVRSRSLAMQKSDELEDVILEVLKKLQDLGISMEQRATAIFTFEDGNKDYEQWVASPEYKSILSFLTPYFDHPVQNDIWEARENGTEFYSKSYSVEVKNSLFKYLFDLPALKNMPKAEKTKALEFEHYSISIAFQKHAALVVVDHSGVPLTEDENTIVLRLNKVFHQTYTRFLDLQKAETQAREAQIEVALERTRTQSMLMQHSDELKTTAQVFHEQLELLGIDSEFSYLWLPDEDEKNHMFWATWSEIQNKKIAFKNKVVTFPLDKSEPSIAACYLAWESEENIHVNVVKPDEVEDYFNTWADLLDGVDKFKPELFPEGLFYIDSYMSYGCFGIMTKRKLSDSEKIILSRFSKEFQRTYMRFLDLQKAEAQAREAQIEASLERVRSRTMAMHRTNELQDVIQTVHQELIKLEIGIHGGSFIAINHEIDKELQFWGSGGTAVTAKKFIMPYFDRPFYTDLFKGIKKGPGFFTESFSAKEKKEFFTFLFQHEPWSQLDKKEKDEVLSTPDGYVRSCCVSKHTSMVIVNHFGRDFTEDENLILKRFARVFEQTYTRFLDLQKAEAQAREAQIEAALERVRSRSMAMHQSEEIGEVAKVLFQQLKSLGGELWGSGFGFCEENSEEDNFWFVTETEVSPNARVPNTIDPAHKLMYKGWKDKQDLFSIAKGGKELADHYKYMLTLPDIKPIFQSILDNGIKFPTWQKWHAAYFKYGYLLVITTKDYEDEAIFKRFAKAFEQAYTRFLDLQKAEAQAREAQIVASLERVRAATMAMHQSKELSNVLSTLFGQYDILGINPSHAVLTLINKEKNTLTFRTTGKNGYQVYAEQEVDLNLYDSWIDTTEKWKKSNPNAVNVNEYPPELLPDVWEVYKDVVNAIPKKARPEVKDFPEGLFITEGYCQFGYIGFAHSRRPTEEEKEIVRRFAVEFGSLYQRFLDLQKAEAQAREAQIEVALEKIRSRTMAMQKGEELKDVVVLLYKELIALGVTNFTSCGYVEVNEETERQLTYVTGQGGDSLGLFYLPMKGDDVFDERYAAWKNQEAVFHQTVGGKERREHLEYAITTFNSKEAEEMVLTQFPDPTVFYCFNFSHGYLHIVGGSRLTTEEEALMARFTRVFEQTYARFLDLKKAEIQTREAQINLAVERVRAKALAMHKSEEIMEVVAKLKEEVMGLDIPAVVAASIFLEADDNYIRMWDLSSLERSDKGYLAITDITFKLKKADPHLYIKRVWENNKNYFVETQDRKDLDRIIEFMYENNQLEIAKEVEDYTKSTNLQQLYHASKRLNNGKLCIDLLEQPPAEMEGILDKIGAAFDLAYQRFLDLQKAEAQTKESQIEAALEKVRSRSLAMQKPDELQEVVAIVAGKLKELGVIFDAGGVILCTYFPDNKDVVHWIAVPDFSSSGRYYVPYFDNPIFNDAWDSKIRGDAFFSQKFPVEVKNHFFEHTFKHSDYRDMPEDYKQHVLQAESHALSAAWSKNSAILIPSLTGVVPSENDAQIIQRFARVFEQAYIRFMDLQQAEIREKEAIKQASLDRVRGEIASMRTTKDLERITPLIWKELTTLGVPFFRCGVFIIREDEKMVHAYLSKPDGTSVAALHIPFSDTDNKLITPTIENWRLQQAYKETWNQDQFIQQTHLFLEKGQIENPDAYDISETPPEQLVLHLIPFKQGMVYVGNHEDLTEDQISLVESLSTAFSVAYSRYEDFKALETAKNSLELTINDLKSAQAQLIQAEKMASLGELTAGIAHEIQNPLNFVNNFSEVSEELIDEMNEELDNGDLEEAKAISKDLKDNLSKINHHGKRADAIVKGMLEHSRINKGEKKPTDINALLDEFVRLSYHGLRAKDKSFNADFKLNLDPNLPKVNVVSSDIGRVILNLVNNAFYACTERSRSACAERDRITLDRGIKTYNPEVIVSSKQTEQGIELSVKDNGGGIPEQVRDKIFQPFFTTKPTGKGTGLGLSLSYDIIKAHGGKLTLESSEGVGTLFSIQIPIQ